MSDHATPNDRLLELLADRAVGSLSDAERAELDALLAADAGVDDGMMEEAAVALMLGSLGPVEPMPDSVRGRVLASLAPEEGGRGAESPPLRLTEGATPVSRPGGNALAWTGWLAAAACLIVAVTVALTRPPAAGPAPMVSMAEAREQFRQSAPDVKRAAWGDWDDPEIAGVRGTVEWSESAQKGYMSFVGLSANNPTEEQYQLWIIDERGMEQRISGAIFNSDSATGEVVVEIDPAIEVHNAAAFAITIEEPGGTWVSDMSRRVVIAALQS